MALFRIQTPQRRANITIKSNYQHYKEELREDFNFRCGYCDDIDEYRDVFYEIDHFVPHKYCVTIQKNTYSNLVYSCRHCNNAKSNKFPTQDESNHHDGNEGFIDPCHAEYATQFERERGKIVPKTPLGEYMWREMNLHLLRHELIYNLEKIDKIIQELHSFDLSSNQIANEVLNELYKQHWELHSQLKN